MEAGVEVPEAAETVMVASQSSYLPELTQTFPPGRPVIRVEATAKMVVRPTTLAALATCAAIKINTA